MKQQHIEDLFIKSILKGYSIQSVLYSGMTLTVTPEEKAEVLSAVLEVIDLSDTIEEDRAQFNATVLMVLIDDYRRYSAESDNSMIYGYYDTEDGSEYQDYRVCLSQMYRTVERIAEG